ncbi:hypothetical protein HF086_012340 [Spodoptera exigua]|uniref:Uncharacterized protein n=1 Tax=Spodoptera exigua TaxID=7107 RepID=A0A922M9P2_SPOEX|nr:hypothetical protein HF086_012340 [Spodoptera exigua]
MYFSLPVSISWCGREECDSLLVAGAALSLWKCTERAHQVHKLFAKGPLQGSTTPGGGPKPGLDCFSTLAWQKTAAWGVEGGERGVCAASTRHPAAPPHAVLATPRALHLLARDTHHYICSRAVVTSGGLSAVEAASTPPKKTKYGPNGASGGDGCAIVSCVEMSHLGGVLVAIDTHAQLHVYRLPQPWADIPTPLAVQLATGVLEWALVAARDPLDVLLAAAPSHNVLELLYERSVLTGDNRILPAPTARLPAVLLPQLVEAQDSTMQSLAGAWAAVSLALRPDDKPDAAVLAALLDDHSHDHEKLEYGVEPEALRYNPEPPVYAQCETTPSITMDAIR